MTNREQRLNPLGLNSTNRQTAFAILGYDKDQSVAGMAAEHLPMLEAIEQALDEKDTEIRELEEALDEERARGLRLAQEAINEREKFQAARDMLIEMSNWNEPDLEKRTKAVDAEIERRLKALDPK